MRVFLNTIKARIIFTYLTIIGVALFILSIFFVFYLKGIVYKPVDTNLLKKAKELDKLISSTTFRFSFLNVYGRRFEIDLSKAQLWIYSSVYSKYYFQLRTPDGKLIEKSASLGKLTLPYSKDMGKIVTVKLKDRYIRLVNLNDKKNQILVQVGYNVQSERNMLTRFEIIVFSTLFFILFISYLSAFYVSQRSLEPLNELNKQILDITEHNLDKKILLGNVPEELKDLVNSFNLLLERLSRAFKREKRFISDVSHELKTPVSVVLMQCDIALRKEREKEEYRKALETVRDTAKMMSNLIEKMLMISKLDALDSSMFKEVNVKDVVRETYQLLRCKAQESDVNVKLNIDEDEPMVKGDKTLLIEMVLNILDNAIKYNKRGGSVEIILKRENGNINIIVEDSGIGMKSNEMDRIFDEFYRIDVSRSKEKEGFGLGLSIVKKIVELHGGRISVKSVPSKGTTVKITLPSIL